MAEMVGSAVVQAVVQEVVSGALSFMRNSHEDMASQSHLMERLKLAQLDLKFALEKTKRMPIIQVSLLELRMVIKHAFEECHDLRVNLEAEGAEQRVPLSPSLPKRIMHVVKPFFSTKKDSLNESCVRRLEWFAEKAGKFIRDVESGCSLALYRFSCPLITQLLEGKFLEYRMVSGSQTRKLAIDPSFLEDYGAVAYLMFDFKDLETPMKCFTLRLMLRLSESTDIVGISTKCLHSLDPQFKSVAGVASGELAQISTQVCFFQPETALRELVFNVATNVSRWYRQEPLCCLDDGFQPSAKNFLSSELTEMFPEQVSYLRFECFISADEYNLLSSTDETNRNTIEAWPILQLSVEFRPHFSWKTQDGKVGAYLVTSAGKCSCPLGSLEFSDMEKFVPPLAVEFFKFEPEGTEWTMLWYSPHGLAIFTVSKPTIETRCAPKTGGSKARRLSKRKR